MTLFIVTRRPLNCNCRSKLVAPAHLSLLPLTAAHLSRREGVGTPGGKMVEVWDWVYWGVVVTVTGDVAFGGSPGGGATHRRCDRHVCTERGYGSALLITPGFHTMNSMPYQSCVPSWFGGDWFGCALIVSRESSFCWLYVGDEDCRWKMGARWSPRRLRRHQGSGWQIGMEEPTISSLWCVFLFRFRDYGEDSVTTEKLSKYFHVCAIHWATSPPDHCLEWIVTSSCAELGPKQSD